MNIAFCISDNYADKVKVVMTSIIRNHRSTPLRFFVFSSSLRAESKALLEKTAAIHPNCRVSFVAVNASLFRNLVLPIDYITSEMYYRYAIAELLPEEDKILYLDADLIVKRNIEKLYSTELEDNYLAGTVDLFAKDKGFAEKWNNANYINSGVLLMNLKKIREDKLLSKLIEKTMELAEKLNFPDQDVLNLVCAGKIKLVSPRYNFTSRYMSKKWWMKPFAVIWHYTGAKKPWKAKCRGYRIWMKYA